MNTTQMSLRPSALLLAAAMTLTACGGGGGGSSDGGSGANGGTTLGGTPGVNACVSGDEVDLQCYMVPGANGESPDISETVYQWSDTGNAFEEKGTRTRAFTIQDHQADIESTGDLSVGAFSYVWDGSTFTINNPDGSNAIFPRMITAGAEEAVTETDTGGGSIMGSMMVFGPASYTLTVPGTSDRVTANNAILRVLMVPDVELVNLVVMIPQGGAVAAIDYLGCAAAGAGSLQFKNDVSYYEETCGHGNFPLKADEASLRIAGGSPNDPGDTGGNESGSCSSYPSTLTSDEVQGLQAACGAHPIRLTDLLSPATHINGTLTVSSTTSSWSIKVVASGINLSLDSASATGTLSPVLMLADPGSAQTATISSTDPLSGSISVASKMYTFDE